MNRYPLAEKFVSINGEGSRAGELAVFLRFRRCNLHCSYCDTRWANEESCPVSWESVQSLADYVRASGVTNVTLTGGEPLLQDGLSALTDRLIQDGARVEIETNGSLPIDDLACRACRPCFTMDYKLPFSGMEDRMRTENFALLRAGDAVKFVAGTDEDLARAAEVIEKFDLLDRCFVYFSTVFGQLEPRRVVAFLLEHRLNRARLQLQLHKYIWQPDARGV